MLQFIKKNKANFIWVLIFGLMGLILRPLVNLSNEYPWVTRILLFLLLIAVYFIHKNPLFIIVMAIFLAEPFIKE